MSIRKEQALLIVVVLLAAWFGGDYLGFNALVNKWNPTAIDLESQPLEASLLVSDDAADFIRRDFFTEPSETRPLPPRELAFPPHAAASLAGLPLDPGPDFRHSWLLRQDGAQVTGVEIERGATSTQEEATAADVDSEVGAPGTMSPEQAAKLYDRVWLSGLANPEYGRIEPQPGQDLFDLEDGGDFTDVKLRVVLFSRIKRVETGARWFDAVDRIQLRQSIRNEVKRQVRKVPDVASAQGQRLQLINWLLEQARSESWIYDVALEQARAYLQFSGGNLDGNRIMQTVLQARGDIAGELDLLMATKGDATVESFRLQGLGVIKARLGLWIEAEENLKEAARLTPSDARAHAALADFYRARGRSREAGASADRAEATLGSVQDAEVRREIERTIVSCRMLVGELAAISSIASDSPYIRGCISYAAGDMTAAAASFQQVGAGLDSSAALLGQAACLLNTGSFQEAYDLFVRVSDQDPLLRHRAMTGLALIFSRVSDFDTALTFVDRALEASPNDTYALYLRGRTMRLMGQYAAAQEALTQALVQHDDFVLAIVEMSLVQSGLASQAIGADQAAFLIGARRYMDRAVALSPEPELELLEMQGVCAFAAADSRSARKAFDNARDLASTDAEKGYAKGALSVVSYSRGRVDDSIDQLERLERDLGRDSQMGTWAGATLIDIADHAEKESLSDNFERDKIGEIWSTGGNGRMLARIRDGRVVFNKSIPRTGPGEAFIERASGVKPAKNFLACSATMEVGPRHTVSNSIVGLGIEIRRARSGVELSARVGLKDGKPYIGIIDGKDAKGERIVQASPDVALRENGPQALELRVVPRSGENNKQLILQIYFNDALVMSHELKQLSGSTQNELKTLLFIEGDKGADVDVAFDDYKLERRKGKR